MLLGVLVGAPSALGAPSAWWHVTSGSRPALLQRAAVGASQVDKLTVSGVGTGVILLKGNEQAGIVSFDASASELQSGLEALYGSGSVEVTGGPVATGTGNLSAGAGTGTITTGSGEVKEVNTTAGVFEEGQEISAAGIPAGTTITKIVGTTLTLSGDATETATERGLRAASKEVKGVTGAFEVGQELSGVSIPKGTTITAVGAGTLTLSQPPTEAGTGVSLGVLAPYTITFKGAFAGEPVALEVLFGEATVTTVTSGRFSGQTVVVTAANLGDADADGESSPVRIVDRLPAGLTAERVEGIAGYQQGIGQPGNSGPVSCEMQEPQVVACSFAGTLPPFDQIEMLVQVSVGGGASSGVNEVSVSGGEAPGTQAARMLRVGSGSTSFGVEEYEQTLEEEGGQPDAQAGSHPFQFTTTLAFNQTSEGEPAALVKDISSDLPAGLIGNPTPFPKCTLAQFATEASCPAQTALGVAMVSIKEPTTFGGNNHIGTFTVPNL